MISCAVIKEFWEGISGFIKSVKAIIKFERKGSARKLNEDIEEEYLRLFGSSAVPLLMKILEGHKVIESPMPEYYHLVEDNSGDQLLVSISAMKTFRRIVKKENFCVSRTLLWDKYSGKKDPATLADFLAKSSSIRGIVRWIQNNYLDPSGCVSFPTDMDMKDIPWEGDITSTLESEVGFLFFSLKNRTDKPVRNLEITFKKALIIPNLPTQSWRPQLWSFEEYRQKFNGKGNPDDYLIKSPEFHEQVSFTLSVLEPGERQLFLIAVYRSDKKGFENGYLDDAYIPYSLLNRSEPLPRPLFLRAPLKEKSGRYFVPYGWFRQ